MNTNVKAEFAARLQELCEEMGLPAGRGVQSELARIFKVTPNAARKWLTGAGMPELDLVVEIANWADVNVNWLLQGAGPKRGNRIETKALVLDEALSSLPTEERREMIGAIRFNLARARDLFTEERFARYDRALDDYFGNKKDDKAKGDKSKPG